MRHVSLPLSLSLPLSRALLSSPSISTSFFPTSPRRLQRAFSSSSLKPSAISAMAATNSSAPRRRLNSPALFICDLQDKFRPAIHEFPRLLTTAQKMLKASKILNIPVYATTQNRARLGETCPELGLDAPGGTSTQVHLDKTLFSMVIPEIRDALAHAAPSTGSSTPSSSSSQKHECVVLGIEAHICVTQTTLDLLHSGHKVYVLADGVSSCNKEEIPIALARLRQEGAIITTSESWLFECMGDSNIAEFRDISKLIKETKESTRDTLQALCKI